MGLATSKHHVEINGNGFTLLAESRRKRAQQPFNPRFSTGDPGFGDLSFWQFLLQEGFDGGQGQETLINKTKYAQSSGWNIRDGKPRLAHGPAPMILTNLPPASGQTAATAIYDDFENGNFNKWNTNGSWIVSNNSGSQAASGNHFSGPFNLNSIMESAFGQIFTQGEWSFTNWHPQAFTTGVTMRYWFIWDKGGTDDRFYVELSNNGANAALYKMVGGVPTLLASASGMSTCVGVVRKYIITRDAIGTFNFYQGATTNPTKFTVVDATVINSVKVNLESAGNTGGPSGLTRINHIDNFVFPSSPRDATVGFSAKAISYQNEIWYCYETNEADYTVTLVKEGSALSNTPTIRHINARDIIVMSRDGTPTAPQNTFLLAVAGSTLKAFNNVTEVFSRNLAGRGHAINVVNPNVLLIGGNIGIFDGIPFFEKVTLTAGSWGSISKAIQVDGGVEGIVCNWTASDSNGTAIFATTDMSDNLGTVPSRLFAFTAGDILLPSGNIAISSTSFLPNFAVRGLFVQNQTLYLFGASISGTRARNTIRTITGTIVYESTQEFNLLTAGPAVRFNYGIRNIFQLQSSILFISGNNAGLYDSVLEFHSSRVIREVAAFTVDPFIDVKPNPVAVIEFAGHFYRIRSNDQAIDRTGDVPGAFTAGGGDLTLELSAFGGNTELIEKSLFAVTVELSEAVPGAEIFKVYINDILVGSMLNADGTKKEFILTAALTGTEFIPKLRMAKESTWAGYLKPFSLRYIPTQFRKWAWGLALRLDRNTRLIDGKMETRTPQEILALLEAAYLSKTPVNLKDIDGVTYKVIFTDIDERTPLVNTDAAKFEAFVFVELLQV